MDIYFKDFNDLFAKELNKSKIVQSYIGEIKPSDIHLLNSMIQFTWLHTLYSHFPTVLNFGKFFYIFSKHQSTVDKFEIHNYHKIKKERKAKYASLSKKEKSEKSKQFIRHLNAK